MNIIVETDCPLLQHEGISNHSADYTPIRLQFFRD